MNGVDGLGHAQQAQPLVGEDGHHVEQGILDVAAEDIAGHEQMGGMYFSGRALGRSRGHLRLSQLVEEGISSTAGPFQRHGPDPSAPHAYRRPWQRASFRNWEARTQVGGGDGVVGGRDSCLPAS